jgi:hypothetical protein
LLCFKLLLEGLGLCRKTVSAVPWRGGLSSVIRVIHPPRHAIKYLTLRLHRLLLALLLAGSQDPRKELRRTGTEPGSECIVCHHLPPREKGNSLGRHGGDRD